MPFRDRCKRPVWIALAGVLLAACASQRDPAQKMISAIDAAVSAASEDAAKYAPDQLNDVQMKLDALKASYAREDYKAVVAAAPPVLTEAQSLASDAATQKAEVMKGLNEQWGLLANVIPNYMTEIQSRIDFLGKKSNRKMAKDFDLGSAKSGLTDATSLWSKAQGAFGNGNMNEAVTAAKDVKARLDALGSSLKVDLSAPAAVQTPPPTA